MLIIFHFKWCSSDRKLTYKGLRTGFASFLGKKLVNCKIVALIINANIWNVCEFDVIRNNPPYKPIPFSKHAKNKHVRKILYSKIMIDVLEKSIDKSRLKATALENNKYKAHVPANFF